MAYSKPALLLAAAAAWGQLSAAYNYSTADMMRAQLALMDDRPKDCPPWYVVAMVLGPPFRTP